MPPSARRRYRYFVRADVIRQEDGTFVVRDLKWRAEEFKKYVESMKWVDGFGDLVYEQSGAKGFVERRKAQKIAAAKLKDMMRDVYEKASYHHSGGSVFGEWVAKALQGHACDEKKPRLSARQLFAFVHPNTQREMRTRYRIAKLEQTVILATPPKLDDLDNKTTVGTIPSVPPKPDTPSLDGKEVNGKHTAIKIRSLKMCWINPGFTGSQPIKYDLQVRGIAKYNKTWKTVGAHVEGPLGPGNFGTRLWKNATVRKNRFNVPHLTSGLEYQFRVRAWNWGGWSEFSEESPLFIPTAATTLSVQATIREAADLGTRNLLDIMRKYSTSMEAIQRGLWMLSTQALKDQGFSRASVSE